MSRLSGALPIFLREMQLFRVKLSRPTYVVSALVTPLMYLLVFGLGLGRQVRIGGGDYLSFLVPGLIGMTAMNNAFNWVANAVNFSRFYYRTWTLVLLAPVSPLAICAGHVAAGIARGLIATALVAAAGFAAGWRPTPTLLFPLALLLEMACFSALGLLVGIKTKTSEEHMAYTNFLITPMGFFCGTFFPLDGLPGWLAQPMLLSPLTQANIALRLPAFTGEALVALGALAAFTALFLLFAVKAVASYAE
ncbi:ABC transporter permease [Propionivibrio sp.]|uniref:ABC transporter permease n=1 Tax=Propionivibrio sp. TaxID=2212460 RepID=UPI0039E45423